MDRIEIAKKFYTQAQRMTVGLAASVVAYGAMGYYLVHMGKVGPATLNAQTYPLVKYGALAASVLGIFAMGQLSHRMFSAFSAQVPNTERSPQKLFMRTVLMSAGAELPLLLGMVLVFLGHQPYDFIPFAAVSLVGFAFAFPKKQEWVSWLGADF
ncbi:MAG: hypothetical protein ABH891_00640 [Candidatus Omnitrophota bacterium]